MSDQLQRIETATTKVDKIDPTFKSGETVPIEYVANVFFSVLFLAVIGFYFSKKFRNQMLRFLEGKASKDSDVFTITSKTRISTKTSVYVLERDSQKLVLVESTSNVVLKEISSTKDGTEQLKTESLAIADESLDVKE